ncbi:hypothetical protein S40288_05679 [Stachybotrys chartarum IBT 40288]|nr:hypothetical protein S40288_05679 [Stachybotrys chartarum IBT 40288]
MDNDSTMASSPYASSSMDDAPSAYSIIGPSRFGYYVAVGVIVLCAWLLQPSQHHSKLAVPFYKASKRKWIFDAENLIRDSYAKFRDTLYQIKATEGIQVLVPPKYIAELKSLPEDVLSATEAVSDALQSKYTKFTPGHNGDLMNLVLRTRLTQNLANLSPQLRDELEYIIDTEFPSCDDWTPVKWQPFGLRIVTRLSGRAFVGPSICRQDQWMDCSINFAVHVFMACIKLQFFPEWARPWGQYLVSDLGKIRRDIAKAKELLEPVLSERLELLRRQDSGSMISEDPPNDMIQWLVEALPDNEKGDVQIQAELQLIVAAAAIHTTNNLLFDCMFDLADDPELQEELRQEAYQVLEEEDGWGKKESMSKLRKLDSFMGEVQRLRGNITGFIRKVMQPITLSDGTQLPSGTKILAPLAGISQDERLFPNPTTFDALRFYRMRQETPESNNRWQFTSVGDNNINFGAGRHACPGRFFASNEIKLIVAHFLLQYDIRLKPGAKRPKPMAMVMTKAPSPTAELEFKRRGGRS